MVTTYRVWCPEDGEHQEDGRVIDTAVNAAHAAEEWAERDDYESAEYRCVGGKDLIVKVREEPDGPILVFSVTAESLPSYYAAEIKEK